MLRLEHKGDKWDLHGALHRVTIDALDGWNPTPGAYWYRGITANGTHIDPVRPEFRDLAIRLDHARVGMLVAAVDVREVDGAWIVATLGIARFVSIETSPSLVLHGVRCFLQTFQTLNAVSKEAA